MKRLIVFLCLIPLIAAGRIDSSLKKLVYFQSSFDVQIILDEPLIDIFRSPDILRLQGDKRVFKLISTLKTRTSECQQPFISFLRFNGIPSDRIKQMWIANEIFVHNVTYPLVSSLVDKLPGEYTIRLPEEIYSIQPETSTLEETPRQGVQWGVEKIGAPAVWKFTRGEGVTIGSIGTGVYLEHEALSEGFGGAWSDPVYGSATPTDQNGFDTHLLGTAVGRANGIGVAPGAQWIGCKAINAIGSGTTANLLTCAQFMLEAQPRPDIILNGWGGGSPSSFDSVISAWKAAGLFAIFPVGGSGPACGSVAYPAANAEVIALSSTTTEDLVSSYSGRGPNPQGDVKPDFAAPGAATLSAAPAAPDAYLVLTSGGSSGAHTAGAIALIKSFNSSLSYDEVIELLRVNAVRPPLSDVDRSCSETEWPNMSYGYGRIDVTFLGENIP